MRAPDQQKGSVRIATCAQCGCLSGLGWEGWRACRIDDPDLGEPPVLAFFCPTCAEREFGYRAS